MATQRSSQDLCHVLRRTHARIFDRDPGSLSRRSHLSPLCASRPTGFQSDHDNAPADGIHGPCQGYRRRLPLLSKTLHECRMKRPADQPDTHHPFGATRSGLVDRRTHRLMQLAAKSPSSRHRSDNSSGERHTSQLRSADQIGVGLLNDERHVPARMKRSFFGGTVGPSNSLSRTMHPHDQPDVRH